MDVRNLIIEFLEGNKINYNGFKAITMSLIGDSSLNYLNLSGKFCLIFSLFHQGNMINSNDSEELLELIRKNTSLNHLILEGIHFYFTF